MKKYYLPLCLSTLLCWAGTAMAYEPIPQHHDLTGLAAEMYNRCVTLDNAQPISKKTFKRTITKKNIKLLQDANVEQDTQPLVTRLLDWHFYNPAVQQYASALGPHGLMQMSVQRLYYRIIAGINPQNEADLYTKIGSLHHFVEDMTNPAHVVPALHPFLLPREKFDGLPVQKIQLRDYIKQMTIDDCRKAVKNVPEPLNREFLFEVMASTSQVTRERMDEPICGGRDTYTRFWRAPPGGPFYNACGLKFFGVYAEDFTPDPQFQLNCKGGRRPFSNQIRDKFVFEQQLAAILGDLKLLSWAERSLSSSVPIPPLAPELTEPQEDSSNGALYECMC